MKYVVGVGSSDTNAHDRVVDAVARIDRHPMLDVVAKSRAYVNPAWGGATAARFVNAAVVVETSLSPSSLLRALHAIESELGRVRGSPNASRTLDLDVLWHVDAVAPSTSPSVPHPRLLARAFAVIPCVEAMRAATPPIVVPQALLNAVRGHATAPARSPSSTSRPAR